MKIKLQIIIISILVLLINNSSLFALNCPVLNDTQIPTPECALQTAKNKVENYADQSPDSASPEFYIGELAKSILIYVGSVFLILMVYAGGLWMTASGNQDSITKAKSIIKTSIIGLVIITFAYSIASFVVQRAAKIKEPEVYSCSIYSFKNTCENDPACKWTPITAATDCKGDIVCEGLKSLGFGEKESPDGICQDR